MKITDELFAFIEEWCQYDWRGYPTANKFYIWIPLYCLDDFIELINFNVFEYGFIEDCSLSKDTLCVGLSYFVYDLEKSFSRKERV